MCQLFRFIQLIVIRTCFSCSDLVGPTLKGESDIERVGHWISPKVLISIDTKTEIQTADEIWNKSGASLALAHLNWLVPNAPFTCSCHGTYAIICALLNALLLSNCHTSVHVVVPILKVSRAHVCNQSFRSRARASCSKIFVRLWRIESESFTWSRCVFPYCLDTSFLSDGWHLKSTEELSRFAAFEL